MFGFIVTTDGGDREDGNVYYSNVLVVDAPWEDRLKVAALIQAYIAGFDPDVKVEGGNDAVFSHIPEGDPNREYVEPLHITFEKYSEVDGEEVDYDTVTDGLPDALAASGVKAEFISLGYIVAE